MPELASYRKLELPRDLAVQVASYVRMQWPNFIGRRTPLWESTPYPNDCLHFVLSDGDVLISHAIVSSRLLEHAGETLVTYGLSSVFCYPTHRGSGFGNQIVAAATDYVLRQQDADLALLFCGERVKSLYQRHGWRCLPELKVSYGDGKIFDDGFVLALLLSDRARARDFAREPLYVGPSTW